MDPLRGHTLKDAYLVGERLGEGAMATVYRGVQLAVGRDVAIKMLNLELLPPADVHLAVQRFRREAAATSRLSHPNTVQLIDFGETEGGVLFQVLEFLDGATVADVIEQGGPIDSRRTAHIGLQITKSLAEAHAANIVHRDIKPENVFLCVHNQEPDFVKVVDFGIARVVVSPAFEERITEEGTTLGSPIYMSPEQAKAQDATSASDLYSLGILLFEMLTGDPPFLGDTYLEVVVKHVRTPPPPLGLGDDVPPHIAEQWTDLILQLLAKDPADRPRDADEVGRRLAQIENAHDAIDLATAPLGVPKSSVTRDELPTADPGKTSLRPSRWRIAALAACLLAGVATLPYVIGDEATEAVEESSPLPAADSGGPERPPAPTAPSDEATPVVESPAPPASPPEPVSLEPEVIEPPPAAPAVDPEPVRLKLTSSPTRAKVVRDDAELCTTPCDLVLPASGEPAKLLISRRGYESEKLELALEPGSSLERTVRLKRSRKQKSADRPKKPPKNPIPGKKPPLPGFRSEDTKRTER